MQAGAYDTVLILFCFSFFPLHPDPSLRSNPLFFPLASRLSFSLFGNRYNVWATGCELFPNFFRKTDPLITCSRNFSLARTRVQKRAAGKEIARQFERRTNF